MASNWLRPLWQATWQSTFIWIWRFFLTRGCIRLMYLGSRGPAGQMYQGQGELLPQDHRRGGEWPWSVPATCSKKPTSTQHPDKCRNLQYFYISLWPCVYMIILTAVPPKRPAGAAPLPRRSEPPGWSSWMRGIVPLTRTSVQPPIFYGDYRSAGNSSCGHVVYVCQSMRRPSWGRDWVQLPLLHWVPDVGQMIESNYILSTEFLLNTGKMIGSNDIFPSEFLLDMGQMVGSKDIFSCTEFRAEMGQMMGDGRWFSHI